MIKKIYIWDDLSLTIKNMDQNKIDKKLNKLKEIANNSQCELEILKRDIIHPFKKDINSLDNIVTIGTRPQYFLENKNKRFSINTKRKIKWFCI